MLGLQSGRPCGMPILKSLNNVVQLPIARGTVRNVYFADVDWKGVPRGGGTFRYRSTRSAVWAASNSWLAAGAVSVVALYQPFQTPPCLLGLSARQEPFDIPRHVSSLLSPVPPETRRNLPTEKTGHPL